MQLADATRLDCLPGKRLAAICMGKGEHPLDLIVLHFVHRGVIECKRSVSYPCLNGKFSDNFTLSGGG